MNYPQFFEAWILEHRALLGRYGEVVYWTSPPWAKRSAELSVNRSEAPSVDLVLWDSGEADFTVGNLGHYAMEHFDLASLQELESLLEGFVEALANEH